MCWGLYRTYSCIWRLRSVDQDVSAGLQYFIIMLFFAHTCPLSEMAASGILLQLLAIL